MAERLTLNSLYFLLLPLFLFLSQTIGDAQAEPDPEVETGLLFTAVTEVGIADGGRIPDLGRIMVDPEANPEIGGGGGGPLLPVANGATAEGAAQDRDHPAGGVRTSRDLGSLPILDRDAPEPDRDPGPG